MIRAKFACDSVTEQYGNEQASREEVRRRSTGSEAMNRCPMCDAERAPLLPHEAFGFAIEMTHTFGRTATLDLLCDSHDESYGPALATIRAKVDALRTAQPSSAEKK